MSDPTRGPLPLWAQQARQWARVKPPLRPSGPDLVWAGEAVEGWRARGGPSRIALILGATPELRALRWPAESRVVAADVSLPMLQGVWNAPAAGRACAFAVRADWLALPLARGSVGLALGDGCFVLVDREGGIRIAEEARRVLEPGAAFLIRVFVRPGPREDPGDAWRGLLGGSFGNFHVFKFRLLMSLVDGAGEVRVAEAWRFFAEHCADPAALARRLDWPPEEVETIRAYRDQRDVYWFPTVEEFLDALGGTFRAERTLVPPYEMGDRCPTFLLCPR